MKKVVIISKIIPVYRKEFYNGLRARLQQENIELILLYGQPSKVDQLRINTVDIDWAINIKSTIIDFGRFRFYWQPVLKHIKGADLVIVEQASKLLVNYVLFLQFKLGYFKLAFWGHGINFQKNSYFWLSEWVKKLMSTKVHWWFAYNELSKDIIKNIGFSETRITAVQNAIETKKLIKTFETFKPADIDFFRCELGIDSDNTCLFIGGMYPEKRINFLISALDIIRSQVNDFSMIFIGGGVEENIVKKVAQNKDWVHYMGPITGEQRIPYFAISKLLLMPGVVGLAILDAFALETPIVTTMNPSHGPEIDYLENNYNGIMIEDNDSPFDYASIVVDLLMDKTKIEPLIEGCRFSRDKYSIESMVTNFSNGIMDALEEL